MAHERKDGHCENRRLGQRQDDLPENAERSRSIDLGRLIQIHRDRHEKLADQKDEESAPAKIVRYDQWLERIQPADGAIKQKERDERDLKGKHHRAEHEEE